MLSMAEGGGVPKTELHFSFINIFSSWYERILPGESKDRILDKSLTHCGAQDFLSYLSVLGGHAEHVEHKCGTNTKVARKEACKSLLHKSNGGQPIFIPCNNLHLHSSDVNSNFLI